MNRQVFKCLKRKLKRIQKNYDTHANVLPLVDCNCRPCPHRETKKQIELQTDRQNGSKTRRKRKNSFQRNLSLKRYLSRQRSSLSKRKVRSQEVWKRYRQIRKSRKLKDEEEQWQCLMANPIDGAKPGTLCTIALMKFYKSRATGVTKFFCTDKFHSQAKNGRNFWWKKILQKLVRCYHRLTICFWTVGSKSYFLLFKTKLNRNSWS